MSEKKQTPGRNLYLHPSRYRYGAPSGCILVSDRPEDDDTGATLIMVDPHGHALSDDEAESMATEICRRWNVMPDLLEALEQIPLSYHRDACPAADDPANVCECDNPYHPWAARVRAALAKARPSQVEA